MVDHDFTIEELLRPEFPDVRPTGPAVADHAGVSSGRLEPAWQPGSMPDLGALDAAGLTHAALSWLRSIGR